MTLQVSGPISFSDLRTEYGDTGSISASDVYRGGSLVPSSVDETTTGAYSAYEYERVASPLYYWREQNGVIAVNWAGFIASGGLAIGPTEVLAGGYRYQRGSNTYINGSPSFFDYRVRRRTETTTSVSVNTSVPASGTIDLTDFYGGRGS